MDDTAQSRRTNILVGDEVLTKIDDAHNVTHQNGVMKIEITTLSNPLKFGSGYLLFDGTYLYYNGAPVFNAVNRLALRAELTWDILGGKPETFAPAAHGHYYAEMQDSLPGHYHSVYDITEGELVNVVNSTHENYLMSSIHLFPASTMGNLNPVYQLCDGSAISRTATAGGRALTTAGCPFGVGDGSTTVNVPTLPDPATGLSYYIYIGWTQ